MPKKTPHVILKDASELKSIPTVESTNTYKAIAHDRVYDAIRSKANDIGLVHMKDQIEITHRGQRAFGNMMFEGTQDGMPYSVAWRSTYDRSASLALGAGASVFVCSNLMLFGSDAVLMKAHKGTIQSDLESLVDEVLAKGEESYLQKLAFRQSLEERIISARQGQYLLAMAGIDGTLNKQAQGDALQHWESAPYTEFQGDRSLWGLYNAMTFGAHKTRPANKFDAHKRIVEFTENIVVENGKLLV